MLAVCALVFLAAFAVRGLREREENIRAGGQTVLTVDRSAVTALSWVSGETSFRFHREEGWIYDGDERFPVSADAVAERLKPFENLTAAFIIQEPESLADYGLKSPECTVTLETADKIWEIRLGTTSLIDGQRYYSIGDGNVYLAPEDFREKYGEDLSAMIQNDTIPPLENVTEIRVSGGEEFTLSRREDGKSHRAEDRYFGGDVPMDTELVESFLNDIRYLTLEEYVTYSAGDGELKACGLDSPEMTAAITWSPEEGRTETFTVSVSRDPAADQEAEGETLAYARIGQSGIIYKIPSSYGVRLAETSFDTLRHQEVFPADFESVTRLEIVLDGSSYTLTRLTEEAETEEGPAFRYQGGRVDTKALKAALEGLKASGFTGEEPSGKEEISLTATLTDGGTAALTLYRQDGETCLAVIDGAPLALVPRSAAMALVEAVYGIVL